MPELPDIAAYLEALRPRIQDRTLEAIRIRKPFLLRTVVPPPLEMHARRVVALRRLGKRIVMELEEERFLILHLMIAGRLQWKVRGAKTPGRIGLAAFDFDSGTLILTEAGTRRRAALHLARGRDALAAHDPGGLEVLEADLSVFGERIRRERHTLKRTLTDPRILSGIGNAYSDEILHRARLSPFRMSDAIDEAECARLFAACRDVIGEWTRRLIAESGDGFPTKVTAFREGMAVHGRYRKPCPDCGTAVQRIVHAENEANYCPLCQTGGRVLADRALSRLLHDDWPARIEDLEERGLGVRDDTGRVP